MAYHRNKRRMNPKLRLVLTFLLVLCLGVSIGLMFTPLFHVQEVFCEGNSRIAAEEIIAATEGITGKNIFLVRLLDLRKQVEKIPMVEKASVRRVFPNKIKISMVECIPAGYFDTENQLVVTDINGKILDILADDRVEKLREYYTPKKVVKVPEGTAAEPESEAPASGAAEVNDTDIEDPSALRSYSVPLVAGLPLHKPVIGKKAESKEKEKFSKAFDFFRHLENNGLLAQATYLDLSDMTDVTLVIENRLEVQFGTLENLEYRCGFLAKVIHERISATESAIIDYRGADIYVRPPEDGKAHMKPAEPSATAITDSSGKTTPENESIPPVPSTKPATITTLDED